MKIQNNFETTQIKQYLNLINGPIHELIDIQY